NRPAVRQIQRCLLARTTRIRADGGGRGPRLPSSQVLSAGADRAGDTRRDPRGTDLRHHAAGRVGKIVISNPKSQSPKPKAQSPTPNEPEARPAESRRLELW